ncbi:MAG: iron ABC transporter permease, partial [Clostridia bacterium]
LTTCVLVRSVSQGAMQIAPLRVAQIILAKLTGNMEALSQWKLNEIAVVWEIRLPRVLAGFFVGAGLSAAGAIFQSLLGNPLADPYTLGVSTGAAFGATLMIFLNLTLGLSFSTVPTAFLMASLTLLLVLAMAERGGGLVASNLIIAGMIVSAILSSAIGFMKMLAGENVSAIVQWMMGSLSSKRWSELALLVPLVLAGVGVSFLYANDLNVMTMGDRAALALGVNVKRTRVILLLCGAMMTAACVSVSGIIGFVGLVVPHMLRMGISSDNRRLLPLSA